MQINGSCNEETRREIAKLKESLGPQKRIVFVSGIFNIVHLGHLRLLKFASECGDCLVVGIKGDQTHGVLVPLADRIEMLKNSAFIDHVLNISDSPESVIEVLRPAVVVKGKEHENQFNPELPVLDSFGGILRFGSGESSFSSVEMIKKEIDRIGNPGFQVNQRFLERHKTSQYELAALMNSIKNIKMLVIGDTIVDEYINCDALGMSQEDPTLVVTPLNSQKFIGGASIVAAHASSLGANTNFFSITGNDEEGSFVEDELQDFNVHHHLFTDPSRMTTLKQRYRSHSKTLLRVNRLRTHEIDRVLQKQMYEKILDQLSDCQLVVFSDFSYGCLPQNLVDDIVRECLQRKIFISADSQSSSQIGDISRFRGMNLVTPTEREARLATNDFSSGLVVVAEKLRKKSEIRNVIITLGNEGILIHAETNKDNLWLTDRLSALNSSPVDVAGAGDSFLTVASMVLAVGGSIWEASALGSIASACQVSRSGNVPLAYGEFKEHLRATNHIDSVKKDHGVFQTQ